MGRPTRPDFQFGGSSLELYGYVLLLVKFIFCAEDFFYIDHSLQRLPDLPLWCGWGGHARTKSALDRHKIRTDSALKYAKSALNLHSESMQIRCRFENFQCKFSANLCWWGCGSNAAVAWMGGGMPAPNRTKSHQIARAPDCNFRAPDCNFRAPDCNF